MPTDGPTDVAPLGVEEYVEQAHLFRTLRERLGENSPAQEVLRTAREEALATTKLPMAIDFLLAELRHSGSMHVAMAKLSHYFTPFQAYVMAEAENDRGRFDLRVALEVLQHEAAYRSGAGSGGAPTLQGLFLYEFEVLCRNRLGYDAGLTAIAADPAFPPPWREWVLAIRRQVGMVDIADLIYVQSAYAAMRGGRSGESDEPLFGEREGRIALANRKKDPLYLFGSLHRQLGYPEAPRPRPADPEGSMLPHVARRVEQLEKRIKMLEEEQRGGLDLTQFYAKPARPAED
ncbi:MAG: hypothetical protein ACRCT8_01220 [Lacipirellulaceae bacterium]